ncbi:MAG: flagellar motor switch protein FliG [Bryobacteraceae bacterium]
MPKSPEAISGLRKIAILMVYLGEDVSGEVLRELDEDEVQRIGHEIAKMGAVSGDQAKLVLEEFHQMSIAQEYMLKGGIEYARKLMMTAYGPEAARKIVDRLIKTLGTELVSFDALHKADPQQLAKLIHNEHPQTIALILSHLNPTQAASLLTSLPPEMRSDIAMRMAHLDQISPEIIGKIATIIDQKLKALGEFSRESYGGVHAVSEMFNRLDSGSSKEILEKIEQNDPNLVETIRHLMFVFEDLMLIDPNGIKEILSRIDRKVLTVALKGTSEQLRDHFLQSMSQRGAQMLREDMDVLGAVKIKDVESAQQQIIAIVRQLETEGVLSLKGAVGEQYVV